MKKIFIRWLLVGGLVVVTAGILGIRAREKDRALYEDQFFTLENNAHPALIAAASPLNVTTPISLSEASVDSLRALLDDNRSSLDEVIALSHQPSRLPPPPPNFLTLPDLAILKKAVVLLEIRAELAQREDRRADAVQAHWDRIRVAQAGTRGGLLIHGVFLSSVQTQSMTQAQLLLDEVTPEEHEALGQRFRDLRESIEPLHHFAEREELWLRRYANPMARIVFRRNFQSSLANVTNGFAATEKLVSDLETIFSNPDPSLAEPEETPAGAVELP